MTITEKLLQAVEANPSDTAQMLILADALIDESEDYADISYAYRWMHKHQTWPAFRPGSRVRKPFTFYHPNLAKFPLPYGDTGDRQFAREHRHAVLPTNLYWVVRGHVMDLMSRHYTWLEAVGALAGALDALRKEISL